MTDQITLSSSDTTLSVLIWNHQPVITLAMIDKAHQREEGTAGRNFRRNRQYFIENEDYFRLTHSDIAQFDEFRRIKISPRGIIVFTLAGYMMLVKSLTDDLAWKVQRELVNNYFKSYQTAPQWAEPTLKDLFNLGHSIEKTLVEVTHTQKGDIISVDKLEQPSAKTSPQKPTVSTKPVWIPIVEAFFTEIERENILETMRKNMLISNEVITSAKGNKTTHSCLFFRPSNLIAFFHKTPHLFELLSTSGILTAKALLLSLKKSAVLAFAGKEKEKGIPIDPKSPFKTRRVSHLIAIDLVVLEQDYGMVMPKSQQIAIV